MMANASTNPEIANSRCLMPRPEKLNGITSKVSRNMIDRVFCSTAVANPFAKDRAQLLPGLRLDRSADSKKADDTDQAGGQKFTIQAICVDNESRIYRTQYSGQQSHSFVEHTGASQSYEYPNECRYEALNKHGRHPVRDAEL